MSSSLRYTFTNLCKPPEPSTSCSDNPGYFAVRSVNTSPTVAPSAATVDAPSAWARNRVGRWTSTAMWSCYKRDPTGRDLRDVRRGRTQAARSRGDPRGWSLPGRERRGGADPAVGFLPERPAPFVAEHVLVAA